MGASGACLPFYFGPRIPRRSTSRPCSEERPFGRPAVSASLHTKRSGQAGLRSSSDRQKCVDLSVSFFFVFSEIEGASSGEVCRLEKRREAPARRSARASALLNGSVMAEPPNPKARAGGTARAVGSAARLVARARIRREVLRSSCGADSLPSFVRARSVAVATSVQAGGRPMVRRCSPQVLVGSSNLANLSIETMVVEGRGVVKRASLWTALHVRCLDSDGVTGLLKSGLDARGWMLNARGIL